MEVSMGTLVRRKKENGYRYYLEEDILRLMFIVYRRKMNQSLEEIERYIKEENSLECMKEHLAMRIKQEEASIQYHQQAIARMQLAERDMDQAEKYEGKYTFKNFPTAYKLGVCESLLEGLKQWFAMSSTIEGLDMTYFYTLFSMGKDGLQERETNLLLYKGVEQWIGKGFQPEQYAALPDMQQVCSAVSMLRHLPFCRSRRGQLVHSGMPFPMPVQWHKHAFH